MYLYTTSSTCINIYSVFIYPLRCRWLENWVKLGWISNHRHPKGYVYYSLYVTLRKTIILSLLNTVTVDEYRYRFFKNLDNKSRTFKIHRYHPIHFRIAEKTDRYSSTVTVFTISKIFYVWHCNRHKKFLFFLNFFLCGENIKNTK